MCVVFHPVVWWVGGGCVCGRMAQMTGEPGTRMTGGTGSEEEMRFTSREARMSILEFATGRFVFVVFSTYFFFSVFCCSLC